MPRRKGGGGRVLCSRMEIEFLSFHLDLTSTCSVRRLFASRSSSSRPLCTHNRVGMHSSRYTASHEIRNEEDGKREREKTRGKREKKTEKGGRDREKKPRRFRYTNPVASFLPLPFFILLQRVKKLLKLRRTINWSNCFDE